MRRTLIVYIPTWHVLQVRGCPSEGERAMVRGEAGTFWDEEHPHLLLLGAGWKIWGASEGFIAVLLLWHL